MVISHELEILEVAKEMFFSQLVIEISFLLRHIFLKFLAYFNRKLNNQFPFSYQINSDELFLLHKIFT
jgi:hypothetical protein